MIHLYLFTDTELEEAGPEVQLYHEAQSVTAAVTVAAALLSRHLVTDHHHLSKGEGRHVAEPHLLEAGARMNQEGPHPHHPQESQNQSQSHYQGQGLGHLLEAHLVRKVSCLMEMVLPILVRSEKDV